jgi:hypothetical protein
MQVKQKTDQEILADAERAADLAKHVAANYGSSSLDADRMVELAAAQTIALEVAKPTVQVAGGNLQTVGKIIEPVITMRD